jgi:hypothetical protein
MVNGQITILIFLSDIGCQKPVSNERCSRPPRCVVELAEESWIGLVNRNVARLAGRQNIAGFIYDLK